MPTEEELKNMSPEEIAELQKQNCPFCKIIKGEIPAQKVYEDDHMVVILDINPAVKGHLLVLPKEHYPILPLLPPEIFKHVFRRTKVIAEGLKKAIACQGVSLFIANGAVAGQQSPHFLFHLIPRNEGDSLSQLDITGDDSLLSEQKELLPSLKQNMTQMMANHLKREGMVGGQGQQGASQGQQPQLTKEQLDEKREKIGQILEEKEDVRNLLINDVESFKKAVESNQELSELFSGVDIDALSKSLQTMVSKTTPQQQNTPAPNAQTTEQQNTEQQNANPNSQEHKKQFANPKTQHPAQQNTEPRPQHPEKQNPDHSTPKSRT
ncbi:MAG: HIT family protein, partial [Nanobdellota archaeon]